MVNFCPIVQSVLFICVNPYSECGCNLDPDPQPWSKSFPVFGTVVLIGMAQMLVQYYFFQLTLLLSPRILMFCPKYLFLNFRCTFRTSSVRGAACRSRLRHSASTGADSPRPSSRGSSFMWPRYGKIKHFFHSRLSSGQSRSRKAETMSILFQY